MVSLRKALTLEKGGVVSFTGAGGKTSLMFRIAHELSNAGESVLTTTTTKIMMPSKDQSPHVILSDSCKEVLDQTKFLIKDHLHISAASQRADTPEGKISGFEPEVIDEISKSGIFQWILVEADGAARKSLKAPAFYEPVIPDSSGWIVGIIGLKSIGKPLEERWVFRHELFAELTGLKHKDPVSEESVAAALIDKNGIMKGCPSHAKKVVFLNMADNTMLVESGRKIVNIICKIRPDRVKRVVIGRALHQSPVVEYHDVSEP
ncbi:MAG: selenium cofactor biosynthesis protein YqeC [Thermodesulfobacteriota bacterium]|nr:selenium cofactor biosynthesis protein YqeC [Thermodesulfobacteriota bacterium]